MSQEEAAHHWRQLAPALTIVLVMLGCTDKHGITDQRKRSIEAVVYPIYDSTGQPQSTYYSANSQITVTTGSSSFEPAGASYTRGYFEEYTWTTPQDRWNNLNTYSTSNTPFGPSVPPDVDVASARSIFGVTSPELHVRSGALLVPDTTRPQLYSDTTGLDPVHLPAGGPPPSTIVPHAQSKGMPGELANSSSTSDVAAWHGAALERMVITPQTTARVLARLRATFSESQGLAGTILFQQTRGGNSVAVTFNPVIGAVTEASNSLDGRLLAKTSYSYEAEPADSLLTLTEVITRVYAPDGSISRTFKQTYSDLTIR